MIPKCFDIDQEISIPIPPLKRPTLQEIRMVDPTVSEVNEDTSPECGVVCRLARILPQSEEDIPVWPDAFPRETKACFLGYQQMMWLFERRLQFPEWEKAARKNPIYFLGIRVTQDSVDVVDVVGRLRWRSSMPLCWEDDYALLWQSSIHVDTNLRIAVMG